MESEATNPPDEIRELRDALRKRESVDHLARAWSGCFAFAVATGIWVKLLHDSPSPLFVWPGVVLCLAVLGFVVREGWRGLRLLRQDRVRLRRLRALEAHNPRPPELF